MKIWKYSILIIGISVLILSSIPVSAETITDGTGDLYHWYWDAENGIFKWQLATDDKPNIDITQLTYGFGSEKTTFTFEVSGVIEDSENLVYWATYTSEEATYYFTYANGEAFGLASSTSSSLFDMEPDYTVDGNTITVEFDSVGEGVTDVEVYGYTHLWTQTGGESGEDYGRASTGSMDTCGASGPEHG